MDLFEIPGGKEAKFNRITVNPNQMGGVPCVRGLRIPVATVVGMIADGMTEEEILRAYPDLQPDDLQEALRFAVTLHFYRKVGVRLDFCI